MSSLKKLEEFGRTLQQRFAVSGDERLLQAYRNRRQRFRTHLALYTLCCLAVFLFGTIVEGDPTPGLALFLFWGVLMGVHGVRHFGWQKDHRAEIEAAAARLRAMGRSTAGILEPPRRQETLPPAKDPLLQRCEEAAAQTRERLNGIGPGEVEALAVVDAGLDQVRELLSRRDDIQKALAEAGTTPVDEERQRLTERIQQTRDAEARALYRSQLEMLEARAQKVAALTGLLERTNAYAESYLAALTNLRMDAARLKTVDLPQSIELEQLMKPVRQLEQQVEGMRVAAQEVARAVRPIGL